MDYINISPDINVLSSPHTFPHPFLSLSIFHLHLFSSLISIAELISLSISLIIFSLHFCLIKLYYLEDELILSTACQHKLKRA